MVNEDKLPRTAYELIELLAGTVAVPEFPQHVHGWVGMDDARVRLLAFQAGARALVDQLVAQMEEERAEYADRIPDGPAPRFARVLGAGRDVHSFAFDPAGLDAGASE